ncbi:MAG: MiaB/RimO family radical SAM methylthiotransferase [Candidatus Lindowbacteria bacterium]|nr:MiaB/RimO family radical SAM methylthiotransferase [Candidatus Lindowbacteria bacterium]
MSEPTKKVAHIATFGCQMNEQESGVMSAILERSGFTMSDNIDDASFVVLETCAIRQKAEDKVMSMLGRLRQRRKRGDADLKIAVCGCMVTEDAASSLIKKFDVNVVLGPRRISRIADAYDFSQQDPFIDIGNEWALPPDDISSPHIEGLSAFVTVMQGCSNNCTFCVVPSRRGQAQSRPIKDIVKEVLLLEDQGYKEVTIIGQNISYYGIDGFAGKARLIDLFEVLEGETGIERIRFATSHPAYINQKFINGFGKLTRVMPHLHLPVQSGSNVVLELMRRGYTVERFMDIINSIRDVRPETAVTTDIIAGFDGERDRDHEATLTLCNEMKFDGAYVFPYSERPGTPVEIDPMLGGGSLLLKVPFEERKRRCTEILACVEDAAGLLREGQVGETVEVLVESGDNGDGKAVGRNPQNTHVFFEKPSNPLVPFAPGFLARVKIDTATPFALKGQQIS